ncbi:hypothetical protein ACLKA6_000980 [Drosophila palustris]
MAQILGLQILCVGILLLGAGCEGGLSSSSSSAAALSDSESYIDECEWIKCPEAETEATECPADSNSIDYIDIREFDDIILNPLEISHDNTRAKRDLQSKCCGMPRCRCNKCPRRPQCKTDEVLIELSQGNGQPGSCCTQYRCGKEPQCETGSALIYWPDKCTKCNSCKLPCIDVCYQSDQTSPSNCLTDDKEIKLDGESWLQGHGCVKCVCSEGSSICQEFSCKPPECKNPIKLPHVCCPVCPDEVASSTAATTSTAANATTETQVTTLEESTETTEQSKVEEAAEKSIEIPEIVDTDVDPFQLETETTEDLLSSSTTPATSTTLQVEEEEEEQTTENTEDTAVTAMENPELDSSSSTFTTSSTTFSTPAFTTERPGELATSTPAALTPESTSWHRDTNIKDNEYHLATARSNDARHPNPTNLANITKLLISIIGGIALLAFLIFAALCWQRRKTMYSSVPHSDCNLSENTNTSDLVLCIDHPDDDHKLPQKQKQLKESVE